MGEQFTVDNIQYAYDPETKKYFEVKEIQPSVKVLKAHIDMLQKEKEEKEEKK
ncbi:MAG: hypothetical protein LBT84_00090 [Spirochaetia bacterium]|jgi:hypothetical protein|nr:hypothetical protein [Spirochaetia bacterium]